MATPDYAKSTELDAVNAILMSVGESPVNTLDTQSPEVAIAQTTLRQVVREVQTEGWSFNQENAVPFTVDANDQVEVSDAILQIDTNRYHHLDTYNVIIKATTTTVNNKLVTTRKLYDLYAKKDTFPEEETLYCDVVWCYSYEDVPQPFKDYMTAKAIRIAMLRMIGNLEQSKALEQDEVVARAAAIEYDTRQSDYNVFNDEQHKFAYRSFRPFQALAR